MLPPSYKGSWEIQDLEFHLVQWWIPPPKKKEDTSGTGQIKKKKTAMSTPGLLLWVYHFVIMYLKREHRSWQNSWKKVTFRKCGVLIIFCLLSAPFLPFHTLIFITGPGLLQTTVSISLVQLQPRGSSGDVGRGEELRRYVLCAILGSDCISEDSNLSHNSSVPAGKNPHWWSYNRPRGSSFMILSPYLAPLEMQS